MIDHRKIAAAIAAELREHPEHWTQHTFARNKNGRGTHAHDEEAVCWCASGLIRKHLGPVNGMLHSTAFLTVVFHFEKLIGNVAIPVYNDRPKRTVDDIINVFERMAQS